MEIQSTGRLRRNDQQIRTDERKGEKAPKSCLQKHREDRIAISQQALAMLEEQNRLAREEQKRKKMEAKNKGGNSEMDALAKEMKKRAKCQKIAARIQSGDKVPPEDERYLQENDPESYQLALALRQPKKDPKEWDTLLDDEDREGGSTESTGDAEGGGDAPESGGEASEA